jgi:succinyl-diaminopimelate desuccinylase
VICLETKTIFNEIEKLQNEMTQTLIDLIRIPAIGPESEGEGEMQKAERLVQICRAIGFDKVQSCDAPDERVPSKKRPNIIAFMKGETDKERLWIITHMDIVPPGEDSLWTVTKPFSPIVKEGKVYGRGSEDNTQATVSSIFALKAFKNLRLKPKRTVALCFVADEESGSKYGIQHLIKEGLFKRDDLVIVPDGGNSDGSFIEIAEKSSIWLKINTIGKQAHASMPDTGLNAHRVGMEFALALDKMLHKKYARKDVLFDPPVSTFEPTKKDRNVDAINIVPGEDTTYLDGRILPCYNVDELLKNISALASEFEKKTGAKIRIEVVNKNIASKPTDERAKIVLMLKEAIKETGRKDVKVGGIGGGTCAAFFRKAGIPAVVWATMDEMAHQPNEYAKIENIVNDAKVFAYLAEQI